MENTDIRWIQRFSNYSKAIQQFERFLKASELNEMEEQGLIKAFEYTYELGWKTLQDLLKENGYVGIAGPKPVIDQSFQDGYITDGQGWIRMHKSRNLASHTYDEQTAHEIIDNIRNEYFSLLQNLHNKLKEEKSKF